MLALYLSVLDDRNFEEDFTEVYNTDVYKRQTFIYPEIFLRERGTVEQQHISHFCSLAQVKFQKEAWVWEKRRQQSLRGKIF